MNANVHSNHSVANPEEVDDFITDMICHLQADRLMFQTGVVTKQTNNTYKVLCSGNNNDISFYGRQLTSGYFIKKVIVDFMKEVHESGKTPEKIAFSVSDSKVSAWVEIRDNDEETENSIYLIESKVNAMNEQYRFGILVTLVESSDNIPVPSSFKIIPNNILN